MLAIDFEIVLTKMKNTMTQDDSDLPMELAAPARRALTQAGYVRLEQLTRVSEAELKQLHGIGPNTIKQLRIVLNSPTVNKRCLTRSMHI